MNVGNSLIFLINSISIIMMLGRLLCLTFVFSFALARSGFGPTDQDWGHVDINDNAHMFWWLHYTTADVNKYSDKPLIIWLQGGPGSSGTGYGNFAELGPLDLNLEPRNSTWVQWANVLFVDNPAGVGFGYVDKPAAMVKNNSQIAREFLVFLKKFYELVPEFKGVPLYIFCESYGGKMTSEIALVIDQATKNQEIEANLKGIALGDSWISPIDSILTYAPYLLNLGQIDQNGYEKIMVVANEIKDAVEKNDFVTAASLWNAVTRAVEVQTDGVDFYNVLTKVASYQLPKKYHGLKRVSEDDEDKLYDIMNEIVAPALNLSQTWIYENYDIYDSLNDDFMRPVTQLIEKLLNETDVTVAVYNGQLDLIVDTPGTVNWVENLNFKDKDLWDASNRNPIAVNGYYEGYVKKYENFAFYWVDRAGHMVPADNPSAMYYILKDVTNNFIV